MSAAIIDSSVIIAILKQEPGSKDSYLNDALVSTVNLTEVAAKLVAIGYTDEQTAAVMSGLNVKPVEFTHELVNATAYLIRKTKRYGLSLGDRACLATAMALNLPVLTADKAWKKAEVELGLDIQLIR